MRSNLGRQGSRRQDLGLVRDIDRSRLRFLFCVTRVQLARFEWTLAGSLMCLVGRSRLIKINNSDKINNDTCEGLTPALLTA